MLTFKKSASAAGYSLYKPFVDNDSVDWGIAAKGTEGVVRALLLELQLKSTSRDVVYDTAIRYRLKLKNYNDLILDGYSSLLYISCGDNSRQPYRLVTTIRVMSYV